MAHNSAPTGANIEHQRQSMLFIADQKRFLAD